MAPVLLPFFYVLLLLSQAAAQKKEEAVVFTPSKYRIMRVHLPPGPVGIQAAVSRGRYLVNFGTREGIKPGSIFQVFHREHLTGLVRVEQVWRDTAHVLLINLVKKIDPASPSPLQRGFYLKPKFVVLETVHFAQGQPDFSTDMHERLSYAARFIRSFPDSPLILEGHSDNTGNKKANLELSRQRAERIRSYLSEVHRLPLSQMHVKGYGSAEPIATNATEEGRQQNRRVDITLADQLPPELVEKKPEEEKK